LGRDGSVAKFGKKPKNYRVDGSQTWEYKNCMIFGRHIIDGMFLAVKYDIGRNYPSWGLKPIAEYEGIVSKDRQFYDASKIGQNWSDLEEREKIVKYCEHDGNDSLALYELMIPSFFYMCQSIPKPFQVIVNSASGSWLNTIMLRSYLQKFHGVPKAQQASDFGKVSGGISFGMPGIHDNVFKIDIKSMYPNIMLEYKVNDPKKDPENNFFNMVEHFTKKRFEQKGMHKKTGDKYYDDLQAASKIFINSCYGMLGTSGLNFNNFAGADLITGMGRQIIRETMKWATGLDVGDWFKDYVFEKDNRYNGTLVANKYVKRDFVMVNADTDSISFRKTDATPYTAEEMVDLIDEINDVLPEKIEYEDDGYFDRVVVVKAKNYILKSGDNIKYKGSSMTDSKKEPALTEMLRQIVEKSLIYETHDYAEIYKEYVKEVLDIKDIKRWATKKSISENLLKSERANETKVVDALGDRDYQIGDKIFVYSKIDGKKQLIIKGEPVFLKKTGDPKMVDNTVLRMVEDFDGDYNVFHYVERVYKTFKILENVIDMDRLPKYQLKGNRDLLEDL
jgi:DNA polymerase elongation subunit (family B)